MNNDSPPQSDTVVEVKQCRLCLSLLPVSSFFKMSASPDGLASRCKECQYAYAREYRRRNLEKARERQRRYAREHPEKKREAAALHRARHPEKVIALRMVRDAIKDGVLRRLPCRECGNPKTEAHHEDYSKPLDVVWLCTPHHKALHKMWIGPIPTVEASYV